MEHLILKIRNCWCTESLQWILIQVILIYSQTFFKHQQQLK